MQRALSSRGYHRHVLAEGESEGIVLEDQKLKSVSQRVEGDVLAMIGCAKGHKAPQREIEGGKGAI